MPASKPAFNEPMLIPAIGIAAGVAIERLAPFTMNEALIAAGIFAVCALIPGSNIRIRIAIGLLATAIGLGAALWRKPGPAPVIDSTAQETVILEGCVVEPSVFAENREQFTVELAPAARARVSLNLREGQPVPKFTYGQKVEFQGRVRSPHNFGNPGAFDFENYLARRNIFWNISTRTGAEVTVLDGQCGNAVEQCL